MLSTSMPEAIFYTSTAAPADEALNPVDADYRAQAGTGGGGSWLNTGTIILIVLAVAAAGGLVWYYFKKR